MSAYEFLSDVTIPIVRSPAGCVNMGRRRAPRTPGGSSLSYDTPLNVSAAILILTFLDQENENCLPTVKKTTEVSW